MHNEWRSTADQSALLGLGKFGGHKVLDGSQHGDDRGTDQRTDPQEVVEQDHAHDDLRERDIETEGEREREGET